MTMSIGATAIVYTILGLVVATAFELHREEALSLTVVGAFVMRTACWPFFAPMLLGAPEQRRAAPPHRHNAAPGRRVDEAERSLLAALESLDGLAGDLFAPQRERICEMADSLRKMRERIAEMDALLASTEFDEARAEQTLEAVLADGTDGRDERADSVRARLRNIGRLKKMRAALNADFERAILKLDEISSQMLLLKFADHPEQEVGELIGDIAATVEGLSEGLMRL
jgi:hypothetical protein